MGSLLLESLNLYDSFSSCEMSSNAAEMTRIDSQSRSDNLDEYLCVVSSMSANSRRMGEQIGREKRNMRE